MMVLYIYAVVGFSMMSSNFKPAPDFTRSSAASGGTLFGAFGGDGVEAQLMDNDKRVEQSKDSAFEKVVSSPRGQDMVMST